MSETRRVDVTPGLSELLTDAVYGSRLQLVKMRSSTMGCVNYKIRLPAAAETEIVDLTAMAQLVTLLETAGFTFRVIGAAVIIPHVWEGIAG